jgi:hypothetical protein
MIWWFVINCDFIFSDTRFYYLKEKNIKNGFIHIIFDNDVIIVS